MAVGAMTGKGILPLHKIPGSTKVNSDYYIAKVLKPIIEQQLPKLYKNELHKVVIHHDQASSHMSNATEAYAAEIKEKLGVTILFKEDIPVKGPDVSPLDFFGFGYIKQRFNCHKKMTLDGAWKALKSEWNKVSAATCKRVIESWKRRLRLIPRLRGYHIEPRVQINRIRIRRN